MMTDQPGRETKEMPRSKDPRNYSSFYHNLSILMTAGEEEIELETTGRNAIYLRNNFYAYIRAWAAEADAAMKRKYMAEDERQHRCHEALRNEEILRKYMVVIDPKADPDLEHVKLRFIKRDLDPHVQDVNAQVNQLIEQTGALDTIAARSQEQARMERAFSSGGLVMKPVVGGKQIMDEFFEMAGASDFSLEDIDTSGVTDEDIQALTQDPPVRDDLSDLIPGASAQSSSDQITDGNQADSPTAKEYQKLMTAHLLPENESEKKS